jgi:hypothetical protein
MKIGSTPSPASQPGRRLGDELATVVRADELRPAVPVEQPLEHSDDLARTDMPRDMTLKRPAGELVDDVQDPQRAAVRGHRRHEVI